MRDTAWFWVILLLATGLLALIAVSGVLFWLAALRWRRRATHVTFTSRQIEHLGLAVASGALIVELLALLLLVPALYFTATEIRSVTEELTVAQKELAFSAMQTQASQQAVRAELFAQATDQLNSPEADTQLSGIYTLAGIGRGALSTAAACWRMLEQFEGDRQVPIAEVGVAAISDFERVGNQIIQHLRVIALAPASNLPRPHLLLRSDNAWSKRPCKC